MPDLSVRIGPLSLRNPILSASGTYGHGLEMRHFTAPDQVGGLVSKTVTLNPRAGNPQPRIRETEAGMLNSIGLENKGIDHYIEHVLPDMEGADTVVVTNIGGESVEEYLELARRLEPHKTSDAFEVNLSCPNVQGGSLPFARDPGAAARVISGICEITDRPVFAKLSPNVSNISEMAIAVEEAGAAAITAVNTLLGMAVDWRTGKPGLGTIQGGYSGPGIKPVALQMAWNCARSVSIPVIGCGGIDSVDGILEFLVAGCTAVQLGTACFVDPALPGRFAAELDQKLAEAGVERVADLIGTIRDGRDGRGGRDGREDRAG